MTDVLPVTSREAMSSISGHLAVTFRLFHHTCTGTNNPCPKSGR